MKVYELMALLSDTPSGVDLEFHFETGKQILNFVEVYDGVFVFKGNGRNEKK